MKPQIVELSNGKHAILVSRFPKRFLDLNNTCFKWGVRDRYFNDCLSSLEVCQSMLGYARVKIVKYIK